MLAWLQAFTDLTHAAKAPAFPLALAGTGLPNTYGRRKLPGLFWRPTFIWMNTGLSELCCHGTATASGSPLQRAKTHAEAPVLPPCVDVLVSCCLPAG